MKRGQAEFRLQVAIADLLRWRAMPGLFWTAVPNGEARPKVKNARGEWYSPTGERLRRAGLRPGNPDLLLIWKGKAIGLELKAEGGRATESQRQTEADWTTAGGLYAICKGYDETVAFLDMIGVLKGGKA